MFVGSDCMRSEVTWYIADKPGADFNIRLALSQSVLFASRYTFVKRNAGHSHRSTAEMGGTTSTLDYMNSITDWIRSSAVSALPKPSNISGTVSTLLYIQGIYHCLFRGSETHWDKRVGTCTWPLSWLKWWTLDHLYVHCNISSSFSEQVTQG